jgi:hypothetical protein
LASGTVEETCEEAGEGVNQIAGQPINSTEQEVIGLLLQAQQQHVFSNSNAEVDSVKAVAMVPREVLQDETVVEEVSTFAALHKLEKRVYF